MAPDENSHHTLNGEQRRKIDKLEEVKRISEERVQFVEQALTAKRRFERTGEAYDASEVFAYFRAKSAGVLTRKPGLGRWHI